MYALAAAAAAAAMVDEDCFETFGAEWCSVAYLNRTKGLTRLVINVYQEECSYLFWKSMAELTGLRDLVIRELDESEFGGIVHLANCRNLTRLETQNEDSLLDFHIMVSVLGRPSV